MFFFLVYGSNTQYPYGTGYGSQYSNLGTSGYGTGQYGTYGSNLYGYGNTGMGGQYGSYGQGNNI